MLFSRLHKLGRGEYLYRKGDEQASGFFFVLQGRVELMVTSNNVPCINGQVQESDMKFSKHVEVNQYFAFRGTGCN